MRQQLQRWKIATTDWIQQTAQSAGLRVGRLRPWMTIKGALHFYNIKTVIDVGANTGQFALSVAKVAPNVPIYTFEPIQSCFDELKKNTASYPNIQCFRYGVGAQTGEQTILVNTHTPSSSLLPLADAHKSAFAFAQESNSETIPMTTLDTFFHQKTLEAPILLKIDVQGYEDRVLDGAHLFLEKVDVILIEMSFRPLYEGQMLFGDLFNLLYKHDFLYVGSIHELLDPSGGQNTLSADVLFVKKGFNLSKY